jgi:hypothetical protein
MMASDEKKTKPDSAPKKEALPKEKKEALPKDKKEALPKDKSASSADPPKDEGGETTAASPAGYSRGEGQKPVSKAYKENWNAIFAKKKKR